MQRSAWIFLAAILLPSLVLAWLAVRSARDQQVVLEHQQAIISQDVTDSLAKTVRNQLDTVRSEFVQITQDLLNQSVAPPAVASDFDRQLRAQWSPAEVGFAVDLRGHIYSPGAGGDPAAQTFREENERFLTNRENAEVYSSLNSQNLVVKDQGNLSNLTTNTGMMDLAGQTAEAPAATPPLAPPTFSPPASSTSETRAPGGASRLDVAMTDESTESSAANGSMTGKNAAMPRGVSAGRAPEPIVSSVAIPETAAPMTATTTAATPSPPTASADAAESTYSALKRQPMESPVTGGSAETKATSLPPAAAPEAEPVVATPAPDLATAATPPLPMANAATTTLLSPPQEQYQQAISQVARQVSPQNNFDNAAPTLSNTIPQESDFRRLIGADTSGALARFLDNKLQLMVWYHPTGSDLVFGAQLDQGQLLQRLRTVLQTPEFAGRSGSLTTPHPIYCVALLDDTGHPVALSIPDFSADWKHPFVATEIGETLPHWEAALYLTDPQQMSKSASTLRLIVGLIVTLLIVAIVAGGSLIATDIRRQVKAAQQKTDFVSNVSHELKTPLTSIRVFADLLAEGRVTEPEKQLTYLKIISAESARLTRLINNVLDFARQERGAPDGERRPCDLVETTRDVVETCLPHLEANGQNLTCEIEAETLPIVGDRDALAQVVLNLISNAEKYGGGEILVRVRRQDTAAGPLGCVDVLDRGPGIPPKQAEAIFLPFHRLHDSLSSGSPGSGIGLTLARRMARVHRGDVTHSPRAVGGSCFTLTVPLTP